MILLPVAFAFHGMSVLRKIILSFTIPPHTLHTLPQSLHLLCAFLPFMTLLPSHHRPLHPHLLFSFPSLHLIIWRRLCTPFPNHLSHKHTLVALTLPMASPLHTFSIPPVTQTYTHRPCTIPLASPEEHVDDRTNINESHNFFDQL
jgi:hypothetical protein